MVIAVCPARPGLSTVIELLLNPPIRRITVFAIVVVTDGLVGEMDDPPVALETSIGVVG
jgi:hypothetical protein